MKLKQRIQGWLGMKHELVVSPDTQADFALFLGDLLVGELKASGGKWQFEYSEEFKQAPELRPLVEFPDVDKVYENDELWQFFTSRIPSTLQPEVEGVLRKEGIDDDDVVALLKRFGARTISNPFQLKYKAAA